MTDIDRQRIESEARQTVLRDPKVRTWARVVDRIVARYMLQQQAGKE